MQSLLGKTVVVIGAGSSADGIGNGRACALTYAARGANVVCVDHVEERAQETVRLIEEKGGVGIAVAADATSELDVQHVVDLATSTYGRLDVLHNNVGVGGAVGTPDQNPPDVWDREIRMNLTTAYLGTRCAVPAMREGGGGGVIINTSSTLAFRFLKVPSVAYAASKAAVEAMTRACAVAYGKENIRVNCIRIGFSETPLITSSLDARGILEHEAREAELDKSRRKVPLRNEHGDPFDVAEAAAFLASDAAKHITGVVLDVDGGLAWAPL